MLNELEIARKRVLMRAEHRGIKEMDIILGRFVRANLEQFDLQSIETLEKMMEINDQKLYQIILGNEDTPPEFESWINKIRGFTKIQ